MVQGTQMRRHLCGIQTAWTDAGRAEEAVEALAGTIEHDGLGHIIVFFSPAYDTEKLTAAPRAPTIPPITV